MHFVREELQKEHALLARTLLATRRAFRKSKVVGTICSVVGAMRLDLRFAFGFELDSASRCPEAGKGQELWSAVKSGSIVAKCLFKIK